MKLSTQIQNYLGISEGSTTTHAWLGMAEDYENTIAELRAALEYYLEPAPTDPDELEQFVNRSNYTPGMVAELIKRAEELIK